MSEDKLKADSVHGADSLALSLARCIGPASSRSQEHPQLTMSSPSLPMLFQQFAIHCLSNRTKKGMFCFTAGEKGVEKQSGLSVSTVAVGAVAGLPGRVHSYYQLVTMLSESEQIRRGNGEGGTS